MKILGLAYYLNALNVFIVVHITKGNPLQGVLGSIFEVYIHATVSVVFRTKYFKKDWPSNIGFMLSTTEQSTFILK